MSDFNDLDSFQEIVDAQPCAPLSHESIAADIEKAALTPEQQRQAEEQLARLEEAMRKDPN